MSRRSDACPHRALRGLVLLLATMVVAPGPALGHAALVHAGEVQAIRVEGRYDTGEPMAGAQVTVFAPASAATPWRQGTTDADGVFLFVPDDQAGRWSVRLRQAGHGAIAHLDLAPGTAAPAVEAAAGAAGLTPLQKAVMAASVVWGCIGTALYFRRSRAG